MLGSRIEMTRQLLERPAINFLLIEAFSRWHPS
jgi:hypothetical protein